MGERAGELGKAPAVGGVSNCCLVLAIVVLSEGKAKSSQLQVRSAALATSFDFLFFFFGGEVLKEKKSGSCRKELFCLPKNCLVLITVSFSNRTATKVRSLPTEGVATREISRGSFHGVAMS